MFGTYPNGAATTAAVLRPANTTSPRSGADDCGRPACCARRPLAGCRYDAAFGGAFAHARTRHLQRLRRVHRRRLRLDDRDPPCASVTKLAVAKDLLKTHLDAFRPETDIGLRAYGHRVDYRVDEARSCQDIELIAAPRPGNLETIATWLKAFQAQGMTPLAASLQQALNDFTFDASRSNSIVMLSDGIETCGGDPCKLVTDLKAKGVNFTIHVIGLSVDGATRQQLQCVAQAAGGTYHDANSQQDLAQALGAVKSDVTKNEVITAHGVNTPAPPSTVTFTPAPPTAAPTKSPAGTPEAVSMFVGSDGELTLLYAGTGRRAGLTLGWRRACLQTEPGRQQRSVPEWGRCLELDAV